MPYTLKINDIFKILTISFLNTTNSLSLPYAVDQHNVTRHQINCVDYVIFIFVSQHCLP